jgi:hypothetical protein
VTTVPAISNTEAPSRRNPHPHYQTSEQHLGIEQQSRARLTGQNSGVKLGHCCAADLQNHLKIQMKVWRHCHRTTPTLLLAAFPPNIRPTVRACKGKRFVQINERVRLQWLQDVQLKLHHISKQRPQPVGPYSLPHGCIS